ncbi:MAG: enoyl-CoA hydratase/isomerase family protein [Pseudomonadota bacterium]
MTETTTVSTTHVQVSRRGAVGVIELSRPDKFNSMSRAALTAMQEAMDTFEQPDSGVRVVLVQAQGKHFCTGADLEEFKAMRGDTATLEDFLHHVHRTLGRLETSALPVVAAAQGLALAGGLEMLLVCDIVFAASDARFGDQHVQYGLVPAWGASQRLPRQIGLRRSLDLMYSGRWIDAQTALQWGLVNYIAEDGKLLDAAMEYCDALAARSRPGVAAMKSLAREGLEGSLDAGLEMELNRVLEAMAGPDPAEGLAAFEARRTPVFKG